MHQQLAPPKPARTKEQQRAFDAFLGQYVPAKPVRVSRTQLRRVRREALAWLCRFRGVRTAAGLAAAKAAREAS